MIYNHIGIVPDEMINKSPVKSLYYTEKNILKSQSEFQEEYQFFNHNKQNRWINYIKNVDTSTIKKYLLLDLLLSMLKINPCERITAKKALLHPLFKV